MPIETNGHSDEHEKKFMESEFYQYVQTKKGNGIDTVWDHLKTGMRLVDEENLEDLFPTTICIISSVQKNARCVLSADFHDHQTGANAADTVISFLDTAIMKLPEEVRQLLLEEERKTIEALRKQQK